MLVYLYSTSGSQVTGVLQVFRPQGLSGAASVYPKVTILAPLERGGVTPTTLQFFLTTWDCRLKYRSFGFICLLNSVVFWKSLCTVSYALLCAKPNI